MALYKFSIGDEVCVTVENHPWLGDYETSGTITGFGYFLNGVATYIVQTSLKEILRGVSEKRISLERKNK